MPRKIVFCFALLGVLVLLFACTGDCVRQADAAQEAGLRVLMDASSSSLYPERVKWLVNAFPAVVLLYLWKSAGYSVILLLSGLTTIPEEQYAAASIDGVSRSQQLRYITLPQMWYSFFFAAVFSLIYAFKSFREIFLIGGRHPHSSIYMLQHFINNAFENMRYPKLATASVLLLLVILVAVALLHSGCSAAAAVCAVQSGNGGGN